MCKCPKICQAHSSDCCHTRSPALWSGQPSEIVLLDGGQYGCRTHYLLQAVHVQLSVYFCHQRSVCENRTKDFELRQNCSTDPIAKFRLSKFDIYF